MVRREGDRRGFDRRSRDLALKDDIEVAESTGVSLDTARILRRLGFRYAEEGPACEDILIQFMCKELGHDRA